MKFIASLVLSALSLFPQLGSATVIRYDYSFGGEGVFRQGRPTEFMEGHGSFLVDTRLRITTEFSFYSDAGQYLYKWKGEKPFDEFQYLSAFSHWISGGIGSFDANSFQIHTAFWITGLSESQDPFNYLTNNAGSEDLWVLNDLQRDERWYVFADIDESHVVPEPSTLSLLALGLAAIGIRRRYS